MDHAGRVERLADDVETALPVERHRRRLRIERHARLAARGGFRHQRAQHARADAAAARFRQHRQTADGGAGQQARGAYRMAPASVIAAFAPHQVGHRVMRQRILLVEFQLRRDALLAHEHRVADARRIGAEPRPVARFHLDPLHRCASST